MWGTLVSQMQTGLAVTGHKITGTLHNITEGQIVTDWGPGHFMALKFTKNDESVTDIKVGMVPTQGSGFVSLDQDMNAMMKVTSTDQRFAVQQTDGTLTETVYYDLSALVLE